jgi:hypothetical protein
VNSAAGGLLAAPDDELYRAIREVVAVEAPLHIDDLASRLASAWGHARAGSRIAERIEHAVRQVERREALRLRGDFVWAPEETLQVRMRAETGIPAERIAPEEYREAVATVLRATSARPRRELINDVRLIFGFTRTGAKLEVCIGSAIDEMLAAGVLGEGSTGLQLRV